MVGYGRVWRGKKNKKENQERKNTRKKNKKSKKERRGEPRTTQSEVPTSDASSFVRYAFQAYMFLAVGWAVLPAVFGVVLWMWMERKKEKEKRK
jgi:hypothetical protein